MPRGDGTGPREQGFDTLRTQPKGQSTGRGIGRGRGAGRGIGKGMGRMGGTRPGAGLGGQCICPACGATVAHQDRIPCYEVSCPKCGAKMTRQESPRIHSWG